MTKRHKVTKLEREVMLDYIFSAPGSKEDKKQLMKDMDIRQTTFDYWLRNLRENVNFKSRYMK